MQINQTETLKNFVLNFSGNNKQTSNTSFQIFIIYNKRNTNIILFRFADEKTRNNFYIKT